MVAKVQPSQPVSGSPEIPSDPHKFYRLGVELKRATAINYALRLGMAAFPLIDKQPASGAAWSSWTANPGVYDKSDAHWSAASGYALSPTRDSLMAIVDLDDPVFLPELLAAAPHLAHTFQVKRGDHIHFYIKLARPMNSAIVSRKQKGHEVASVRAYGAYVVGPHSDHASGQSYIPNNNQIQKLSGYEQDQLLALFVETRIPMSVTKQSALPIPCVAKPGINSDPSVERQ